MIKFDSLRVGLAMAASALVASCASFADPLTAHNGYLEDARVIDILTDGVSRKNMSPLVEEKCRWQEERAID